MAMEIRCILQARSALGESALWSPAEHALYWLDQIRPEIHRLDPATGIDTRFPLDLPAQLGALVPCEGGGLVLAASDGISVLSAEVFRPLGTPVLTTPRPLVSHAASTRSFGFTSTVNIPNIEIIPPLAKSWGMRPWLTIPF